jgi:hypothetical protein
MAHVSTVPSPSLHSSSIPGGHARDTRRDLLAGALAGQVAGLVMAVVMIAVFTLVLGTAPLYPVQVIGSLVFGEAALSGLHVPAVLAGLVLHQAGPSLAWGLAFGALVHAFAPRRAGLVLLGVAVGLLSQVIDVGLVVPAAMRALHGRDLWAEHVPAFWSWAAHLVFGLSLACFPWIGARLDRRGVSPAGQPARDG